MKMAPPSQPERHAWVDEWMGAATHRLQRVVHEGLHLVEQHEHRTGTRKRQRRPVDNTHHTTAVEVLIANLAHAVLMPPETGRLAILTGNGPEGFSRYDNSAFGKPLRDLLGTLEGIGWLDWRMGYRARLGHGVATSIAPTATFRSLTLEAGISLADFGRVQGEEVIIATRKVIAEGGILSRKELVNYPETKQAQSLRDSMKEINAFIGKADITFLDDGLGLVDLTNRVQRRYFVCPPGAEVPSFNLGGRLYGGAWQNLAKARRAHIRIEGEPIRILDYSSMAPRLAYALVGETPPPGDIYALPGLEAHEYRAGAKKALNTLLCDSFTRQRGWPDVDGGPLLPAGWTVPRFRTVLLQRHPAFAPFLGKGMAHHLQHVESNILIEVLKEMKARSIPILSLHDGVFCPVSKAPDVRVVMEEAALDIARAAIPVDLKPVCSAL